MRHITLYINNQQADLSDGSFVLLNLAMDDLTDPTVVRNSYTQEVKLPRTPQNDAIFGHYGRVDRQTTAYNLDASQRTAFVIFDDMGRKLHWGYCKLGAIDKDGYSVTLYGGLGDLFQTLSYNADGTAMTLADLPYISGEDDELDFDITAASVQAAWTCLQETPQDAQDKYNTVNFAPAYNGIPDGDFDAKHGLVKAADCGLTTQTADGYKTNAGYTLVTLPEGVDEWAAKDLRCYLQRPVVSLLAVFRAMAAKAQLSGWALDYDALDATGYLPDNWHLSRLWLTLPTIPSLGGYKQSGNAYVHLTSTAATTAEKVAQYSITGVAIPSGAEASTDIKVDLLWRKPTGVSAPWYLTYYDTTASLYSLTLLQVVAYDASGAKVGGSKIKAIGERPSGYTLQAIAAACGVVMPYNAGAAEQYDDTIYGHSGITLNTSQLRYKSLIMSTIAKGAASYALIVVSGYYSVDRKGSIIAGSYKSTIGSPIVGWSDTSGARAQVAASTRVQPMIDRPIYYSAPSSLRSGAHITKRMLLGGTDTPAAYLLGLVKMLGLVIYTDADTKTATITTRNAWYTDGKEIDLTDRIDNTTLSLKPIVYDAQLYEFSPNSIGGRFADEYKAQQGVEYGAQRVNTGYAFDSDTKTLTDGIVYKGATPVLARGPYLNFITLSGVFKPSPLVSSGCKQTLWTTAGESSDIDIPAIPSGATVSYLNTTNHGYDYPDAVKLEYRDASGKPVKDGSNVLCMLNGWQTYDWFKITDDLGLMDEVNDGKPCWLLDKGAGVNVPIFSREIIDGGQLFDSLDYGAAKVLDIPATTYDTQTTVYQRAWRAYLNDRFNKSTKTMTCSVDLHGYEVNNQLFRHFYFYRGCWWVLQSIENHSITTDNLTKCTFVQVQDKAAYTDGQFKED